MKEKTLLDRAKADLKSAFLLLTEDVGHYVLVESR